MEDRNDLLGWPERWPQEQQPEPLMNEPRLACYKIHPCARCDEPTSYIGWCARCRATQIALDFHHLREEVRNGLRSDWPLLPHIQQAIDHTKRAAAIAALTLFAARMTQAIAEGFVLDGTVGKPEAPIFWLYPEDEGYEAA